MYNICSTFAANFIYRTVQAFDARDINAHCAITRYAGSSGIWTFLASLFRMLRELT